jgi:hypothetical protein
VVHINDDELVSDSTLQIFAYYTCAESNVRQKVHDAIAANPAMAAQLIAEMAFDMMKSRRIKTNLGIKSESFVDYVDGVFRKYWVTEIRMTRGVDPAFDALADARSVYPGHFPTREATLAFAAEVVRRYRSHGTPESILAADGIERSISEYDHPKDPSPATVAKKFVQRTSRGRRDETRRDRGRSASLKRARAKSTDQE